MGDGKGISPVITEYLYSGSGGDLILLELCMMEVVSGDNWSYKACKVPVRSSPPAIQHPAFYVPDAVPVTQPAMSEY